MLSLFTNIPNPYNHYLYGGLRETGADLRVVYKGSSESEGRPWAITIDPRDEINGSILSTGRNTAGTSKGRIVILSGGYIGAVETIRRVIAAQASSQLWYWGERVRERRLLHLYRRWYFGRMDGVLAIGSWAQRSYAPLLKAGCPVHVFPYTTAARTVVRKPAEQWTIGFSGALIRRKGLDLVLQALAGMPPTRRPRLEVVGSGPLRADLETLSADLGLVVDWIGELDSSSLDSRRSRWWAQVVPSRYDGWGVVVSEAMATGVPAIVSEHVGAGLDLVRDGYNGTRVRDPSGWAAAIERYSNPAVLIAESDAATVVGEELSSTKASRWLVEVLGDVPPGECRSFVSEAWERVLARHPT